jgi:hypothetical protein
MSAAPRATIEGFIRKKAMKVAKKDWQQRYLVLSGVELSYYATFQEYAGGKAAKKRLTLSAASTVKTTGYFNPNDVEITIKAGKVLYFYPDTKREQEAWVAAINAEIDKLAAAAKPIGMKNR